MLLVLLVAGLLFSHLDVGFHHVFGDGGGYDGPKGSGLGNVLADFVGGEDDAIGVGMLVVHMDIGHMASKESIGVSGGCIENEEKYIEAGEESSWQVDVLDWRDTWVVAAI